jgi:hypothetical protein
MSILHDRQLVEADPTVRLTTGDRVNILVPATYRNNVDSIAIDSSEAGRPTRPSSSRRRG